MFDTSRQTLRHYENIGLLKPEKDEKEYRYYGFDDMAKMRQILVLKDLGFPLEDIKIILEKKICQSDFEGLLIKQNSLLKKKIQRYEAIQGNINRVLDLLKEDCHGMTFAEKVIPERTFMIIDSSEDFMASPKAYYDRFKTIIESSFYNERSLVSAFEYDRLDIFDTNFSKFCIELTEEDLVLDEDKDLVVQTFKPGKYLSVFYVFKEGSHAFLKSLKTSIEAYLNQEDLILDDPIILEFEHPELAMMLEDCEHLYEIQMKVR
jgi:DNA-binding transcriptional MerR regulator